MLHTHYTHADTHTYVVVVVIVFSMILGKTDYIVHIACVCVCFYCFLAAALYSFVYVVVLVFVWLRVSRSCVLSLCVVGPPVTVEKLRKTKTKCVKFSAKVFHSRLILLWDYEKKMGDGEQQQQQQYCCLFLAGFFCGLSNYQLIFLYWALSRFIFLA